MPLLFALIAAGCGHGTRAAGTWTGLVKPGNGPVSDLIANAMKGPSDLTLNPDGTGFLKISGVPEEPISWKQEGDKLILQSRPLSSSQAAPGGLITVNSVPLQILVGTLSQDGNTLRIDLGQVSLDMNRSS